MSLFAELKRRNVIRVGVAYLVGAWLLLQVTDVLMSVLGLPAFTGRLVFALLVIGFVPALVFSWAYQVTPEGLRRDTGEGGASLETARNLDRATIAMLVVVASLVLVDRFLPEQGPEKGSEPFSADGSLAAPDGSTEKGSDPFSPDPDSTPSLAVLPFANMSPDAENEYFADGISEELLNLLVKVDGLRVPSRTSSFAYKGLNKDIREIARELQVDHILEGSVRKAGNQVRITAQLIDTDTDTHLWSQTWDRELADIFAIQEEIANHIVEALKGVLAGGPIEHRPTDNLEAYTLFLQGRHLFQQRGEHLLEAESLLRQAVTLDPEFAEAWATLAVTLTVVPNYLSIPSAVAMPQAKEAAERALALQPDSVEALLALAQVELDRPDLAAAIRLDEQAVAIEPDNALARLWLAIALINGGYLREALPHLEHAAAVEPNSAVILDWYARILASQGQYAKALDLAERALRLGRPQAFVPVGQIALTTGDAQIARSRYSLAMPGSAKQTEHMIILRADPARLPEALAYADEVARDEDPQTAEYLRMTAYLAVLDAPRFFKQLEVIQSFDNSVPTVAWAPHAAGMRGFPAMREWIRQMGLDTLWRQRGAPDYCVPDNEGWRCE